MRMHVLLTRQDWDDDSFDFEDIYVPVTLYQLKYLLLAMRHCNRPSHRTAMEGCRYETMLDIEEHLEGLIETARERLRKRTDDGAGEVS